jgi:hypothetical protein
VVESLPADDASPQKRRSTRIVQAVPITVSGVDALGQPFKERTTTVMVNCHGCKYQSKHYVPKNSTIKLEIPRTDPSQSPYQLQGRVIWVQRPRAVRELFQIGLEFETAGNFWGIAFPPEDWFPAPGEEAIATSPATAPGPAELTIEVENVPTGAPPPASSPENRLHVMPPPTSVSASPAPTAVPAPDSLATAKQMARMVEEAKATLDKSLRRDAQSAINDEMTIVRQQLDVQLHEAVEHAIKVSMERVSESAVKKVVQQAAERTNAIVEEARKVNEVGAENLDAKVRQAVEQAVNQAANQAAQYAAEQAAAHNLKNAVEEAVERVISQREASNPSLSILSSPEAAQQQLDQWKRNLEETAQGVRAQSIEAAQTDVAAAKQRWNEDFEAALSGALQHLRQKIQEASQASLTQADRDLAERQAQARASLDEGVASAQAQIAQAGQELAERQSSVKASLDEAITSARAAIESLGAGLEQERAKTQETKAQLDEAGRATIEKTRRNLEDVAAAQYQEAVRRADEAIADRARQIEPALQATAQQILDYASAALDQKLAPKIDDAHRAASELDEASEQAKNLQSAVRDQVQRASDQAAEIESTVREHARKVAAEAAQVQATTREHVQRESQQAVDQSLARLRQESAKVPAEFEQSVRATLGKIEEEFEQRSVGAQHETYEALSKAADWYQKKAHTTMQASLEKAVEQSTSALRGRAAEISSLVASELDHYRRSYVEHSQAEIEEAAKEIVAREREKLGENAEMAHAGFVDRVQGVAGTSLRQFEDASRIALEKARADMAQDREGAVAAFQKTLEEKMMQTVEQAQVHFQSQIGPVIEALEANRKKQQQEWLAQLKKSTDESIEQYKARLENASNSWLLASATTLGQHSQAVLDTLAKSAEKRMRESVAGVLAGMGDTLKDRLMGISSGIAAEGDEEEDDSPPPKK